MQAYWGVDGNHIQKYGRNEGRHKILLTARLHPGDMGCLYAGCVKVDSYTPEHPSRCATSRNTRGPWGYTAPYILRYAQGDSDSIRKHIVHPIHGKRYILRGTFSGRMGPHLALSPSSRMSLCALGFHWAPPSHLPCTASAARQSAAVSHHSATHSLSWSALPPPGLGKLVRWPGWPAAASGKYEGLLPAAFSPFSAYLHFRSLATALSPCCPAQLSYAAHSFPGRITKTSRSHSTLSWRVSSQFCDSDYSGQPSPKRNPATHRQSRLTSPLQHDVHSQALAAFKADLDPTCSRTSLHGRQSCALRYRIPRPVQDKIMAGRRKSWLQQWSKYHSIRLCELPTSPRSRCLELIVYTSHR